MTFARYPSLEGRTVLVTGGGSGIGASVVEAFARQGARTAFVDIQEDVSRALADRLTAEGHPTLFLPCDLTDIAALKTAIAAVKTALGPIGVLVNNAANDQRHASDDVTVEYWDWNMDVNLRHQFFACQAVRPHMQELGGGSIVNFSSIAWMAGAAGLIAYTTAKAATMGLTRSLASEYGPDNIRVNAVAPGACMTEKQLQLWYTEETAKAMADRQCIKRRLEPDELARAVLFLAADDSRMITKQCLIVDGGVR